MNKVLTTIVLISTLNIVLNASASQKKESFSKKMQTNTLLKITYDSLIEAHKRVENETKDKQIILESQFFKNFEALGKTSIPAEERKNLSQVQLKLWETAIDYQKHTEIYEDIEKRYAFPGKNRQLRGGVNHWQEKPIDKAPEARLVWEYLLIRPIVPGTQTRLCCITV